MAPSTSSCAATRAPRIAVDVLKAAFATPDVRVTELRRGEGVVAEAGVAA